MSKAKAMFKSKAVISDGKLRFIAADSSPARLTVKNKVTEVLVVSALSLEIFNSFFRKFVIVLLIYHFISNLYM